MPSLTRILVASDLSPGAARAVARGIVLAAQHEARLLVLHVAADGAGPGAAGEDRPAALETELRRQVEPLVRRHAAERPVEVETLVVPGRDFVQIIAQARAAPADLVVVGAHGAHAVRNLFVGTTAERVIRKADRPVLLVKRAPRGPYRRVVVPVDFSDVSRAALEIAAAVAPGAALTVLHAADVDLEPALRRAGSADEAIQRYRQQRVDAGQADLDRFLEEASRVEAVGRALQAAGRLVEPGRAAAVIPETARRRRADLVVMGTHGRSGLPHLLLGSVAEHVLRDATCDVLAVRPPGFRFEMP